MNVWVWMTVFWFAALASFASIVFRRRPEVGVLFQFFGGGLGMMAWFVAAINAGTITKYSGGVQFVESNSALSVFAVIAGSIMFLDLLKGMYTLASEVFS